MGLSLDWSLVKMRSLIILPALVAVSLSQPRSVSVRQEQCSYNCNGWPYEQCEMEGQFRKATCVTPYASRSSSVIISNYPECATVPSGCQRCDDVCSARDGKRNKLDYISQSSEPRRPKVVQPSSPTVLLAEDHHHPRCVTTSVPRREDALSPMLDHQELVKAPEVASLLNLVEDVLELQMNVKTVTKLFLVLLKKNNNQLLI